MIINKHENSTLPIHYDTQVLLELLKGKEKKRGVQRLVFLMKNANQTFSPYQVYRQTDLIGDATEPFLHDIPIYDIQYIKEMKDRLKVLHKYETERELTKVEIDERLFLFKELRNALCFRKGREYGINDIVFVRSFKKSEDNRSYAAIKMSMMRLFPDGSQGKGIIAKYLIFRFGKFSWGEPMM